MTSHDVAEASEPRSRGEYSDARPSRFRFKSKRSRDSDGYDSSRRHKRNRHEDDDHRSHRHHHRHHGRRHKSYATSVNDDPSAFDDRYNATTRSDQYMDPNQAFRESLFDALADDEGAAYWEGVYGQPIHTYPNTYETPTGELERMTDEEYAEHVRTKMWEKTHQHIVEERDRIAEEMKRRKAEQKTSREKTSRMQDDHDGFQRSIAESLRRGEKRKAKKKLKAAWERYVKAWEDIASGAADKDLGAEDLLPWPVESGRVKHVSKDEVERFFRAAPLEGEELATQLKTERVRWHPDKIQQKFAERGIADEMMKAVTAIFQVIDRMWGEMREKKANG